MHKIRKKLRQKPIEGKHCGVRRLDAALLWSGLTRFTQKAADRLKSAYQNKILFGASLTYTKLRTILPRSSLFTGWNYSDQLRGVANDLLFLGAIPLEANFEAIIDSICQGVGNPRQAEFAFLSVLEPFETASGRIYKPALKAPKNLSTMQRLTILSGKRELAINNLHLPTRDYGCVEMDKIQSGVAFIHSHVSQGVPVYGHCKAGRGRSVVVVAAYLLLHQFHAIAALQGKDETPFLLPAHASFEEQRANAVQRFALVMDYMRRQRAQVEFAEHKNNIIFNWYLGQRTGTRSQRS